MKSKSSTTVRLRYQPKWNEWQKLHNHKVNGDYPVLMNRIPNCENFHKMYPGCDMEKDNVFQCININLSRGGKRMGLLNVITGSHGYTTHIHSVLGLICALVGIIAAVTSQFEAVWVCLFLALGNISCAQGCTRQKLSKMQKD